MALTASELTLTSTFRPGAQAVGLLRRHTAAAVEHLAGARPSGARIHAARKELKRARATLRLLREAIDAAHFAEADAVLRGVARQLNGVRDADELLRTFEKLRDALKESKRPARLAPLRKLLQQEHRTAVSSMSRERLQAIKLVLRTCKQQSYGWSAANDLDLLTAGMQRTYRKGRVCYRAAREARSNERLHAWRRQVKYCVYQLETIRSIGAGKTTRRLRACAKIADLLGKDHDLAMLQERAALADLDAASALHVADEIRDERAKLQRRALRLGERLYRIKVRNFKPLRH
jgi:CHAD domain-containing protein